MSNRGISVTKFVICVSFSISSFELVDDFVCLHSVYSGIDGRVSLNGVWPFIACMQSVLANKKRDEKKSMKNICFLQLLIIFIIAGLLSKQKMKLHPMNIK